MTKQETGRALLRAFAEAARALDQAKRDGGRTLAFVAAMHGRRVLASPQARRRAAVYAAALSAAYSTAFGS